MTSQTTWACLLGFLMTTFIAPLHASGKLYPEYTNDIFSSVNRCLLVNLQEQHKPTGQDRSTTPATTPEDRATSAPTRAYCEKVMKHLLDNLREVLENHSQMRSSPGPNGVFRSSIQKYGKEGIYKNVASGNDQSMLLGSGNEMASSEGLEHKTPKDSSNVVPRVKRDVLESLQPVEQENDGDEEDALLNSPQTIDTFLDLNHLEPSRGYLDKLREVDDLLKASQTSDESDESPDFNNIKRNSETTWPAEQDMSGSGKITPPSKRVFDTWLRVIRSVVTKRPRQALSINNNFVALLDMINAHRRDEYLRNQANLRYHMVAQG